MFNTIQIHFLKIAPILNPVPTYSLLFVLNFCIKFIFSSVSFAENIICPPQQTVFVRGTSMQPLLKPEQKLIIQPNYYKCHGKKIKLGDLVIVKNGRSQIGLVKKIFAIPGDEVSLIDQKIIINGQAAKTSNGEILLNQDKMLKIYITKNPSIMPTDTYLVLGDNNKAPFDSRRFGFTGANDINAKIIKIEPHK